MSFKGNFNEIDLKEIWNKKEFYEGLTEKDIKKLEELDYAEWLARTNIVNNEEFIADLLVMAGIVELD